MTFDLPGGGNFLTQLLGDLVSMMGAGGTGERLELARRFAQGVASGGQTEPNVDPVDRIRLEELLRVADIHVAELTGLAPASGGAPLSVDAVAPGTWALRTVEDWAFLLDDMSAGATTAPDADAADPTGAGADDPAAMMARLMAGMGPMLAALQFGSAVGHLARTTLGQYEIPIWRRRPALLVVPGNLRRFAEDWSLPLDDVSLWVCLREVTTHAVLGRPHVRDRIAELLRDVVGGMAGEAAGAVERLQQLDPGDPEALTSLFSDPERLMGEPSPERLRASAELTAVIAALLGYVEHVLDGTATRLLGGRGALAEAWRRRQVDRESPSRTAEMLFGLDLGPATVAQGVEFVSGVLSRAGEDGLGRLWSSRATLPTPAELSAPGLWLERTSYGEDAEDGGT
jgi:putative hydrolase